MHDRGYLILMVYFSLADEEKWMHKRNLLAFKEEQGVSVALCETIN